VLTSNTQFEHELRKVISDDIDRIKDILADGKAVPDYAEYKRLVGEIAGMRRVAHDYCEEVETKLSKQR
jgi:hypothetical protein